jgi:hypothetical protein
MSLVSVASCGHHQARVTPSDPFEQIAVSRLVVGSLAGSNVLLLTVGGLLVDDTTSSQLLGYANAALDSALRRDAREVSWLGLEEQRRAARRNPTLGLDPDHFATQYLFDPRVDHVPDPLWAQLRALVAVSSARYALVPAGVKISGAAGARTAAYVLVLVDARAGTVLSRLRAQGTPAATGEAALRAAAGTVIATPLH